MEHSQWGIDRSRPIVCPLCESGEVAHGSPRGIVRCDGCDLALGVAVLETLRQIRCLPDALGEHPCECGHPEMRLLPERVFHCPACRSEVLTLGSGAFPTDDG